MVRYLAGCILLVWAVVLVYYRMRWPSLAGFSSAMDHCADFFCDFREYFYAQGKTILDSGVPTKGYFYSVSFALFLHLLGDLPLNMAMLAWGASQAVLALGLFVVTLGQAELDQRLRWPLSLAYALVFATSVPLLHNAAWGQVSILLTCCIFLALWLYDRGFRAAAAIVLAASITIKYYPAIFLVYFVFRRDWRFILACLAGCLGITLVSSAILGLQKAIQFQLAVNSAVASAQQSWIRDDINAQFFPYVVGRLASRVAHVEVTRVASLASYLVSALVVFLNTALLFSIRGGDGGKHTRWSLLLLFTTIPFLVPTSWPHYFAYLPAIQLFACVEILGERAGSGARLKSLLVWVIPSVLASNILLFNAIGDWQLYSQYGLLFLSNALMAGFSYSRLLPRWVEGLRRYYIRRTPIAS